MVDFFFLQTRLAMCLLCRFSASQSSTGCYFFPPPPHLPTKMITHYLQVCIHFRCMLIFGCTLAFSKDLGGLFPFRVQQASAQNQRGSARFAPN